MENTNRSEAERRELRRKRRMRSQMIAYIIAAVAVFSTIIRIFDKNLTVFHNHSK